MGFYIGMKRRRIARRELREEMDAEARGEVWSDKSPVVAPHPDLEVGTLSSLTESEEEEERGGSRRWREMGDVAPGLETSQLEVVQGLVDRDAPASEIATVVRQMMREDGWTGEGSSLGITLEPRDVVNERKEEQS